MQTVKERHFIFILACASILLIGLFSSPWYFLLFSVVVFYQYKVKLKLNLLLIYFAISILPCLIYLLIHSYSLFSHITGWIDTTFHFSIRNSLINYSNNKYDERSNAIVQMFIFGIKTNSSAWDLYHKMAELQIVYLIVVGGFQLMFVKKIILWIFKKKVKIGRIVATSVLLFYCYLLNFSVASLRVILCMLIANSNKVKNKFDIIGIAGALTLIISPSSVFNIGFCLSYLCTVSILIVTTISFDSELIKQICINASCLIVSIPFVLKISSQISIWSLLFCLIFSHIFVLIYIFYLFNFILLWFWPVILTWTSSIIFYGLKTLADSNTLVTLPSFGALGTTIYLLLISAVFIFAIKHFNVECSKNNVQLNRKEERDIFI